MLSRLLLALLVITPSVKAGDVPWLAEVTTPPKSLPKLDGPPLAPLLKTAAGQPITDLAGWNVKRAELRKAWLDLLGPMPDRPANTAIKVLRTDELPDVVRQLIEYENEPGQMLQAYVLRPRQALPAGRKRAGIVALHPTTNETIEPIAGLAGPEAKQTGLQLARKGFVVICPRNFLWQDAKTLPEAVEKFKARHPQTLGMHKMLYDAQRATDILAGQPDVDPERLGSVGHSLGAKEVLYLAAFDERIKATVSSEGGLGLWSTNWEAPWYLGPAVKQLDFPRNHHELIALIAPRPFLVLAGESGPGSADGDRSWPVLRPAQDVAKFYGSPVRLGIFNHHEGHSLPHAAQDRLAQWLEVYLTQ